MANEPVPPQTFRRITWAFRAFAKPAGIAVTALSADRHGSLIWEGGAAGFPNHYITLSLTPISAGSLPRVKTKKLPIYERAVHQPASFLNQEGDRIAIRLEDDEATVFEPSLLTETDAERDEALFPCPYYAGLSVGADNTERFANCDVDSWLYRSPAEVYSTTESDWLPKRLSAAWKKALALGEPDLKEEYVVSRRPPEPHAIGNQR